MIIIDKYLQKLESQSKPIRIGLVGAGYAGSSFAHQVLNYAKGMRLAAIANRTLSNAASAFTKAGVTEVIEVSSQKDLHAAISAEKYTVTEDYSLLCQAKDIDVIVEATGDVEFGAEVAMKAMENKKHIVLINAELDCTLGPILKQLADKAGVIYTQADGDQPAVIMNLIRKVKSLGLKPVLGGNIKTVLDHYRTPDTQKKWAEENSQSLVLATSAADGTKLAMEMATVANATGFKVGKRGMHGPSCAHVNCAIDLFPKAKLLEGGLVDFIQGAEPGFGVFVIAYTEDTELQKYLKMYKMGDGPLYIFYEHTHLCGLEAPLSVARAALYHDAALAPLGAPVAEVIAIAKKDLKKGDKLDGIGGYTCYGLLENYDTSLQNNFLPIGLAKDCVLNRDISKDSPISCEDVALPKGRLIDSLKELQTKTFDKKIYYSSNTGLSGGVGKQTRSL